MSDSSYIQTLFLNCLWLNSIFVELYAQASLYELIFISKYNSLFSWRIFFFFFTFTLLSFLYQRWLCLICSLHSRRSDFFALPVRPHTSCLWVLKLLSEIFSSVCETFRGTKTLKSKSNLTIHLNWFNDCLLRLWVKLWNTEKLPKKKAPDKVIPLQVLNVPHVHSPTLAVLEFTGAVASQASS